MFSLKRQSSQHDSHKCIVKLLVHLNLVILWKHLLFPPKPLWLHITVFGFPIVILAGVERLTTAFVICSDHACYLAHASTHFHCHCCCHHAQVRAVKLRRERIVVALEHKVLVYDFKDLKLLHSIETLSNPMGLVALSPSQDQTVMACPGLHCGQVSSAQYAGCTKVIPSA